MQQENSMSTTPIKDSLNARDTLTVDDRTYGYSSLPAASRHIGDLSGLPYSLKVLLENLLRNEDGITVEPRHFEAMAAWMENRRSETEIQFRPARVLMQDFTGVPAVVDLAAMRDALEAAGSDPARINPISPVDLVIDHSVMVDNFGDAAAFADNVSI